MLLVTLDTWYKLAEFQQALHLNLQKLKLPKEGIGVDSYTTLMRQLLRQLCLYAAED